MHMNMILQGLVLEHSYFYTGFMQNACLLQKAEKLPREVKFSYLTRQ